MFRESPRNYAYFAHIPGINPRSRFHRGVIARKLKIELMRRGVRAHGIRVGHAFWSRHPQCTAVIVHGLTHGHHRHVLGWLRQCSRQRYVHFVELGPTETFGAEITPFGLLNEEPIDSISPIIDGVDRHDDPGHAHDEHSSDGGHRGPLSARRTDDRTHN